MREDLRRTPPATTTESVLQELSRPETLLDKHIVDIDVMNQAKARLSKTNLVAWRRDSGCSGTVPFHPHASEVDIKKDLWLISSCY